jgi:hypothetical protein
MKNSADKPVKLVKATEEARNPMWKSKEKGMIPIKDVDNEYLQQMLLYAQSREWHFLKKSFIFTDLIKAIDDEANSRGIKLKDLPDFETQGPKSKRLAAYWKNNRKLQEATKVKEEK